jgi:hypothetical protein
VTDFLTGDDRDRLGRALHDIDGWIAAHAELETVSFTDRVLMDNVLDRRIWWLTRDGDYSIVIESTRCSARLLELPRFGVGVNVMDDKGRDLVGFAIDALWVRAKEVFTPFFKTSDGKRIKVARFGGVLTKTFTEDDKPQYKHLIVRADYGAGAADPEAVLV